MKRSVSYTKLLVQDLRDLGEAAGYLNAVLETGHSKAFLSALREVVRAHGGISRLARQTKLHRHSLHRILSSTGNPEIQSLERILEAIGLRLQVTVSFVSKRAA